jgi:hypothetical protein
MIRAQLIALLLRYLSFGPLAVRLH